jgi:LysR family nitrogen assimilation transcriptional regulator
MMGRIDVAVLYDTFDTPLLEKRTVFTEELFLVGPDTGVPREDPSSATLASMPLCEIARYPLVIPGRMHAIRRMVESAAAEQGVRLRIELEVDAVTSILDLVSGGIGHAVLSQQAITSDPLKRRFQLLRIVEPTLFSQLAIATSKKHTLSQLAIQAIAMIESRILPLYGDPA